MTVHHTCTVEKVEACSWSCNLRWTSFTCKSSGCTPKQIWKAPAICIIRSLVLRRLNSTPKIHSSSTFSLASIGAISIENHKIGLCKHGVLRAQKKGNEGDFLPCVTGVRGARCGQWCLSSCSAAPAARSPCLSRDDDSRGPSRSWSPLHSGDRWARTAGSARWKQKSLGQATGAVRVWNVRWSGEKCLEDGRE